MARLTDEELAGRHPGVVELLTYFETEHLPEHLQDVSRIVGDAAHEAVAILPDGPELTTGLRKLLEGKDCLVRQALRTTITRSVHELADDPTLDPETLRAIRGDCTARVPGSAILRCERVAGHEGQHVRGNSVWSS